MKFAGVSKFNTESPNYVPTTEEIRKKPAPGLMKLDSSQISERLIESVNMVKDLVCKNSKLRDTIDKQNKKEIQFENELLDY